MFDLERYMETYNENIKMINMKTFMKKLLLNFILNLKLYNI